MLLSTQPSLEILALDSRESFQRNKEYYLRQLEEETEPAVRELLERDVAHLDAIQFSSASSRKFVLVLPLDEKAGAVKARCGSWRKPPATTGSACVWRRNRM